MKLENARISALEFTFAIICFIQASLLRTAFVMAVTGRDSWAMAITGFLACLPLVWFMALLTKWFPGKNLLEINDAAFGPVIGKVFSCAYIFFFLTLAALNTRDLSNFVVGFMMPETPISAALVLFIIACGYAIRKGIENITRLGVLFSVLVTLVVIANFVLILKDADFRNLLPVFRLPPIKFIQGTHIVAAIPFGEVIVFMLISPTVKEVKKVAKSTLIALACSAAFMVFIVVRDIVTLGALIPYMPLPSFEAVRLVNFAEIITRMESLYAIFLVIMLFFKVSILFYAVVLSLAQLLKLQSYGEIVYIIGALIVTYAILTFPSAMQNAVWGSYTAPFFSTFFEYALPGITIIIARLRGLNKPVEAEKA